MIHTTPRYARAWRACATLWVVVGLSLVAVRPHHPTVALRAALVAAVLTALLSWALRIHRSHPVAGLLHRVLRDGLHGGLAVGACAGWTCRPGAATGGPVPRGSSPRPSSSRR